MPGAKAAPLQAAAPRAPLDLHCARTVAAIAGKSARLSPVALSAALAALLKLVPTAPVLPEAFPGLFSELVRRAKAELGRFKARSVANVLHNLVESGLCENVHEARVNELAMGLLDDLMCSLPELSYDGALSVVSIVHSLARVKSHLGMPVEGRLPRRLLSALDRAVLTPKDVAILSWSLAKLDCADYGEFVEQVAEMHMNKLEFARDLVNVQWALACLNKPRLLGSLGERCIGKTSLFTSQDISNSLWAFATAGSIPHEYLKAMEHELLGRDLHKFTSQGLSVVCWSMAQLANQSSINARVFEHLSSCICYRDLVRFSPQSLSNMLLAYAKVDVYNEKVIDAIAKECLLRGLGVFEIQHLANMIWALGALQVARTDFALALVKEWSGRSLNEASTCGLASVAWGLAVLGISNGALTIDKVALEASHRFSDFKPPELAMLVWACACADAYSWPGVQALLSHGPPPAIKGCSLALIKQFQDAITAWNTDMAGVALPPLLRLDVTEACDIPSSRPSSTHLAIASKLQTMGCQSVQNEVFLDLGVVVDIVVLSPRGKRVVVEVDGPYHYLRDRKTPNGYTKLKQRLLRKANVAYFAVSVDEWHSASAVAQQAMLVSRMLQAEYAA